MGGQDGIRGYLVQAIIAVIGSLSKTDWEYLALEPDVTNQKVDIQWWNAQDEETVYQVKSSINNFDKAEILGVLNDLVIDAPNAAKYSLVLIGTYSGETKKFFNAFNDQTQSDLGKYGSLYFVKDKIEIALKALDIDALDAQVESLLHAFLSKRGYLIPHPIIQLLSLSLSAQLTRFATDGRKTSRSEFIENILTWMREAYPKEFKKENEKLSLATYHLNEFDTGGSFNKKLKINTGPFDDRLVKLKSELLEVVEEANLIRLPPTIKKNDFNHPNRITFLTIPISSDLPAEIPPEEVLQLREQLFELFPTNLSEDFFNVGQAMRSQITSMWHLMGHGPKFTGTSEEIKKSELLNDLQYRLKKLKDFKDCCQELASFRVLPLVMINDGNQLQTNIELQLSFPNTIKVLSKQTFPAISYSSNLEFFSYDAKVSQSLFIMPASSTVKNYDYRDVPPMEMPIFDPFFGKKHEDYERMLNDTLDWLFDYRFYHDIAEQQTLSCSFKGIKPKNAMALPSYLLFIGDTPFDLDYHFKSDQSGDSKGVLKITH